MDLFQGQWVRSKAITAGSSFLVISEAQNKIMETETKNTNEHGEFPLWRIALRHMREMPNFGYGLVLTTDWFERELASTRSSNDFAFQMMALRQELENTDGYYLQSQTVLSDETGLRMELWQIPAAAEHEGIAKGFESKMRRYAWRSAQIRAMTLANDKAELTDEDRKTMDSSQRIASMRLILLRREKRIADIVKQHEPDALEDKK